MKKNDRPAALRLWQVRAVLAEGEICASVDSVCRQKQMMLSWIIVFNVATKYRHCNMPFSKKNKTVVKNLYQFKEYGLQEKTGNFTLKMWETWSTDQRHEAADWNACIIEENGTTVDKLLDPVSQEDQKQTYLSKHQIAKKIDLSLK